MKGPYAAIRANPIAERFVGTIQRECLDWILVANRRHLVRVLRTFVDHYNGHQSHRVLDLAGGDRANVVPLPSRPTNLTSVGRPLVKSLAPSAAA